MTDRSGGHTVRREPVHGPPERTRYEPRDDGGWMAIDEVWTGCVWRPRGRTALDHVAFENMPDGSQDLEVCR